jgi:hypothetical protein
MLNDETMNGFEDSQKMIEETSQTAIGGGKSKRWRRWKEERNLEQLQRSMSGERSKNSPEKRIAARPHEPQVATSNLTCAWLRSDSRTESFCRRVVTKFVFVGIAKLDDHG